MAKNGHRLGIPHNYLVHLRSINGAISHYESQSTPNTASIDAITGWKKKREGLVAKIGAERKIPAPNNEWAPDNSKGAAAILAHYWLGRPVEYHSGRQVTRKIDGMNFSEQEVYFLGDVLLGDTVECPSRGQVLKEAYAYAINLTRKDTPEREAVEKAYNTLSRKLQSTSA